MKKLVSGTLGSLVALGVFKGLNESDLGGADLGQILSSVVDGVADLTIYLVPTLWNALTGVLQ